MTKQEHFKDVAKKITYLDVINAFNQLNKKLGGEYYSSANNLITPEGKKVPGFIYNGYAAGVGIRHILDALNIKYSTHIKSGSGTEEQSEIHIVDATSQKRILDIFEKCGDFKANLNRETNTVVARNLLLQQIR
jgi:hypothetical protein